jgi:hypothetical protein
MGRHKRQMCVRRKTSQPFSAKKRELPDSHLLSHIQQEAAIAFIDSAQ